MKTPRARRFKPRSPPAVERAKIEALTSLFVHTFGTRPRSFRAGRFGIGGASLGILADLGYTVDSSVTPFIDWSGAGPGAPDFRQAPFIPYHPDPHAPATAGQGPVWEIPVTIRPRLAHRLPVMRRFLARRLRPRWLRPTWGSAGALIDLARDVWNEAPPRASADATRAAPPIWNVMFHNVEVVAGASPYSATEDRRASDPGSPGSAAGLRARGGRALGGPRGCAGAPRVTLVRSCCREPLVVAGRHRRARRALAGPVSRADRAGAAAARDLVRTFGRDRPLQPVRGAVHAGRLAGVCVVSRLGAGPDRRRCSAARPRAAAAAGGRADRVHHADRVGTGAADRHRRLAVVPHARDRQRGGAGRADGDRILDLPAVPGAALAGCGAAGGTLSLLARRAGRRRRRRRHAADRGAGARARPGSDPIRARGRRAGRGGRPADRAAPLGPADRSHAGAAGCAQALRAAGLVRDRRRRRGAGESARRPDDGARAGDRRRRHHAAACPATCRRSRPRC